MCGQHSFEENKGTSQDKLDDVYLQMNLNFSRLQRLYSNFKRTFL